MKSVVRAVIATALFVSMAGFAAQGSANTLALNAQMLPIVTPAAPSAVPAPPTVTDTPVSPVVDGDVVQPGDVVAYPTLDAAVAAQRATETAMDDEQLRCLAGAIYFESRGEPLAGQLAVAEVVINRSTSGRFPPSICGVVRQPAQFSFVRGGQIPSVRSGGDYARALAVARVAMKAAWQSQASKALYFHARRASPGWSRTRLAAIGNHVFYR